MREEERLERVPAATQPLPVEAPDQAGAPDADLVVHERVLTTKQLAWRRFKRHKLAIASLLVLVGLGAATLVVPIVSHYGYADLNLEHRLEGPSGAHWLGTDILGRDEFTRVLLGGRISLLVGVSVAIASAVIGGVVGAVAGYYGRWLDNLLMRLTDLFLAIPFLVVLLIGAQFLAKFLPGGSLFHTVLILSLFFWMPNARIVRGVFLSLKEKEFVEAARASGARDARIIFHHMLPNALGPMIVNATLGVAAAILTESALSFLGFGVQPPTPTWGNLLNDARGLIKISPGLTWFPGLAILLAVLCVNFFGDGLRDALDPRQKLGGTG